MNTSLLNSMLTYLKLGADVNTDTGSGDFFGSLTTLLNNVSGKMQEASVAVIVICCVCAGLMHMFGEGLSAKAKRWLLGIVIGGCIVFLAGTIAETIKNTTEGF